ncbi:MAG: hypothetical protein ACWGSD_19305, partial [Thermodesulfobacteriota bacterium]
MLSRKIRHAWIGVILVSGTFLLGQDCAAQSDPCDAEPCQTIDNAVAGTCVLQGGGACSPGYDFACACDPGYTWQDTSNTCQLVSPGPTVQIPT